MASLSFYSQKGTFVGVRGSSSIVRRISRLLSVAPYLVASGGRVCSYCQCMLNYESGAV